MQREVTFTITAVAQRKQGETNGRRWTLYDVTGNQPEERFTTFDGAWAQHKGETVTATYEVSNGGAGKRLGQFANTALVSSRPSSAPDRFNVLTEKLDHVLADLAAIRRHFV